MTAPIRWKEANSEASAELREVMQYARACKPDAAQLTQLTAAVIAELPAASTTANITTTWGKGKLVTWGLVIALGGIGGVATYFAGTTASPPAHRALPPARLAPPAVVIEEPPPAAPAVPSAHTPPEHPHEQRHRAKNGSVSASVTQPESEIGLLQAARRARAATPERALLLLSEHEQRYPDSMFTEEREALRIEILQHTRPDEAARRLRDFDQKFPRSAYRQRIGDAAR